MIGSLSTFQQLAIKNVDATSPNEIIKKILWCLWWLFDHFHGSGAEKVNAKISAAVFGLGFGFTGVKTLLFFSISSGVGGVISWKITPFLKIKLCSLSPKNYWYCFSSTTKAMVFKLIPPISNRYILEHEFRERTIFFREMLSVTVIVFSLIFSIFPSNYLSSTGSEHIK